MIGTDNSFSAGTSIEVLNANHHFQNVYIFVWQNVLYQTIYNVHVQVQFMCCLLFPDTSFTFNYIHTISSRVHADFQVSFNHFLTPTPAGFSLGLFQGEFVPFGSVPKLIY